MNEMLQLNPKSPEMAPPEDEFVLVPRGASAEPPPAEPPPVDPLADSLAMSEPLPGLDLTPAMRSIDDLDDDEREATLYDLGATPSVELSLSDLLDSDQLNEAVSDGSIYTLAPEVRYEWDWGMTETQRMRYLSDKSLRGSLKSVAEDVSALMAETSFEGNPEEVGMQLYLKRIGAPYAT